MLDDERAWPKGLPALAAPAAAGQQIAGHR